MLKYSCQGIGRMRNGPTLDLLLHFCLSARFLQSGQTCFPMVSLLPPCTIYSPDLSVSLKFISYFIAISSQQVLDLVDTISSDAAMRGVSREEKNKFYGSHFREHVSDSLTTALEDYEHRAAHGLLSTSAEAPVFQDLMRSKTLFQVGGGCVLISHRL